MSTQIIEREGKPEYAQDLEAAREARRELDSGEDELIPAEMVEKLIAGDEHPLKIWREYRGITQEALGREAGVGKSYISQIEAGNKSGSARVLKALADTLNVDIDDLLVD